MIGNRLVDGFEGLTLSSAEGELEATFIPEAGMIGCSLRHRGVELLGQRGGLPHCVAERSTMGIPLLHPWANRVAESRFRLAGGQVDLDLASPGASVEENGLPIHGLLSAAKGWSVERHESIEGGAALVAGFDFAAQRGLMAAFPFAHELRIEAILAGSSLTIATTVTATGDTEVPISFGYHPYFSLPGIERAGWEIEIPVSERLELDDRMIPTGERAPVAIESGALGTRTFDDGYLAPAGGAPMSLAGGGRRIAVALGEGYPYTQVYAPDDDDVVALEPMTAPTNALVAGGPELPLVAPGESFRAAFSVTVTADG
jgi:aldose 1-epimerase